MLKDKMVTLPQAVSAISDNDTVALNGFIGAGVPEELYLAVREKYMESGHPSGITLLYAGGQGDSEVRGANIFALKGLLKRVICGHWNLTPRLQAMALAEEIEAYNLPQGVITQLFRDISAHRPGNITRVGLNTFVDPDYGGGRLNAVSAEDLVKKIELDGEEYLFYKAMPVDIALLRGTCADAEGNISFRDERCKLEALDIAIACRNSGGKVIVQVKEVQETEVFPAEQVDIPYIFVDYIVKNENPMFHSDTYGKKLKNEEKKDTPIRRIIAKRAAQEIEQGDIINLGIGLPENMAQVLPEEILKNGIVCTLETGVIGGVPRPGINFGSAEAPISVLDSAAQFNFYDGGGLDKAFLGMAECDLHGNVNVSSFSNRIAGAGGFINISQNTPYVIFCGLFSVGAEIYVEDGRLVIRKEGKCKIVNEIGQITYNSRNAERIGQRCLYITERAVFRLKDGRLELTEIAPGIDLEKDILAHLHFALPVSRELKQMDAAIFEDI